MRKFKIKNRRKRKYVKKNDPNYSFSPTQTLTIGLVPLALMSVAFLTTAVMYSPVLASIRLPSVRLSAPSMQMPEVTMPKISLPQFSLPAMPEVRIAQPELPKGTVPEAPKVTIANPFPYIAGFFRSIGQGLVQIIQAVLQSIEFLGSQIATITMTILIGVRNGIVTAFVLLVQGIAKIVNMFVQLVTGIIFGIGNAFVQTGTWFIQTSQATLRTIQQISAQVSAATISWAQATASATVKAWNAFVWFIGTPFRAIGKAMGEFKVFMSPYVVYLGMALNRASDDLENGGNALMQGSAYVSESVEHTNSTK